VQPRSPAWSDGLRVGDYRPGVEDHPEEAFR
jgi:hypothetical protein